MELRTLRYFLAVAYEGNETAVSVMNGVFEPSDAEWRGLGLIPGSGFALKEEYRRFDIMNELAPDELESVRERVGLNKMRSPLTNSCVCGDVICGIINPLKCKMFGKVCTPINPLGPCMVSSEGSCAAAYKYRGADSYA